MYKISGLSPVGTLSYQHLRLDSSNPSTNGPTSSTQSPLENYSSETQPSTNGWPQSPRTRIKTTAFPTTTAYTNGQTPTLPNLDRGTFQVKGSKLIIDLHGIQMCLLIRQKLKMTDNQARKKFEHWTQQIIAFRCYLNNIQSIFHGLRTGVKY
jgi:hypothetical protein